MEVPVLTPLRLLGLLVPVLVTTALGQQPEAQFVSQGCHVAFGYPANWEVVPDTIDPQDPCRFSVRPHDWRQRLAADDSVDLYTISVQIVAQGIWNQVEESSFQRRGTGWVVLGRQDIEQPADTISGVGWTGLRGTATQGCYREEGDYAGLCDQPTALVGTSGRSIMIIGGPQSEEIFHRILATLRFQ